MKDGIHQILDSDGHLRPGTIPSLDEEFVLEALRRMMISRECDAKFTALNRQGRLGVVSPVEGQEASVIGSAMAFEPQTDWLIPQYRELPAYLIWGFPLAKHILNLMGNPIPGRIPHDVKMLPTQIAIGAQLPHAVGLAWGLQIQGISGIVLAYCGDGATSEGDFHEACNLAGVLKAPIVFFVQNNQWAISTPRSYQSAARYLSDRAPGYGIAGEVVDGNDLLAVYDVTRDAVKRARAGDGPTLIEALTYRMSFHNTSDQPSRYRDAAEVNEQRRLDPLRRVQAYLASRGMWSDERERLFREEAVQYVEAAVNEALQAQPPEPSQIFDHVFAELTPRQRAQRRGLLAAE